MHQHELRYIREKCGAPHRGYAVFIRNNLPELGANLVAALAALNVNDFSHFRERKKWQGKATARKGRRRVSALLQARRGTRQQAHATVPIPASTEQSLEKIEYKKAKEEKLSPVRIKAMEACTTEGAFQGLWRWWCWVAADGRTRSSAYLQDFF